MSRPVLVRDDDHNYFPEGLDLVLPSVTTILDKTVADPPFSVAAKYGQKLACQGIASLLRTGHVGVGMTGEDLVARLKAHKLTPDDHRQKAADTGTAIHKALEEYGEGGKVPQASDFPEADHPRIKGLCGWLLANRPVFFANEVLTCSLEHGYAGTFDGKVRFEAGEHKGKTALIDLKNTNRVYDKAYIQLEAYAQAEREWGEPEMDFHAVLHLSPAGRASLKPSKFGFEDFLVLLRVYQRVQSRKGKR